MIADPPLDNSTTLNNWLVCQDINVCLGGRASLNGPAVLTNGAILKILSALDIIISNAKITTNFFFGDNCLMIGGPPVYIFMERYYSNVLFWLNCCDLSGRASDPINFFLPLCQPQARPQIDMKLTSVTVQWGSSKRQSLKICTI